MSIVKTRSSTIDRTEHADKTRILVVDDERDLQDLLRYNLIRAGFSVTVTDSGEEALRFVQGDPPALILLDLMLPGMHGLDVCRALKSDASTAGIPIVMLTASTQEAHVVAGLEMGSDDYMTKPFSPRVLIARLKAILRRGTEGSMVIRRPIQDEPSLTINQITIIPERHEVRIDGNPVELTVMEFRLMYMLARRPGRVFTRQQIIESLHEGYAAVADRSVDVQMVSLRRKLGSSGKDIQTIRGVGYRLRG